MQTHPAHVACLLLNLLGARAHMVFVAKPAALSMWVALQVAKLVVLLAALAVVLLSTPTCQPLVNGACGVNFLDAKIVCSPH